MEAKLGRTARGKGKRREVLDIIDCSELVRFLVGPLIYCYVMLCCAMHMENVVVQTRLLTKC